MRPSEICFRECVSDNTQTEVGVTANKSTVYVSCISFDGKSDVVSFPIEKLDWVIGCLDKIKEEMI